MQRVLRYLRRQSELCEYSRLEQVARSADTLCVLSDGIRQVRKDSLNT
jgi:hypothetical protein